MVPYLEMDDHMFFCLGTEGSKGSLFRNVWFQSGAYIPENLTA